MHPAHRQHALIARLAAQQGEQSAHVHADQPVGARAAQRRVVQVERLVAWQQACQGLADGGVVQCRQPQALHRAAVAAMLDQFAGDHFAFAVGVGGDHQFARFAEQALDRLELAGGLGLDQHFPLFRDDRQVGQVPALVAFVVAVGRGGFQQVADAPGDADVGALPAAVAFAVGAEHFGNVFCLGGFFTEEQAHGRDASSGWWAIGCASGGAEASFIWMDVQVFCQRGCISPEPASSRVNPLLQGRVVLVGAGLPAKRPAQVMDQARESRTMSTCGMPASRNSSLTTRKPSRS
ncbi:hypothetical protein D3C80_1060240 [compost metagenome]